MMTTKAAYFYDLKVISDDKKNVENLKLIDLILPGGFFQVTKYDEKGKPETFPLTLNISPLCTTENDIMSSMKEQIGISTDGLCHNVSITELAVKYVKAMAKK
ncbi:MAG: hypothetical protein V8R82_04415 [Clostridia bacterium]